MFGAVAPPLWDRGDVVAQVALAFVLDVEGEDVAREVFPLGGVGEEGVAVREDVCDAVVEVGDGRGVLIEENHVVLACLGCVAVYCW